MVYRPINSHTLSLRVAASTDLLATKSKLDALSKSFFPLEEEGFKFLDETMAGFYESDLRLRKVLGMATVMALVISLLGLFALTSFTIAQRTKEISIRKVLGASFGNIMVTLSKEYVWLVLISFVLATVPAWFLLNNWLKDFQFRIDMPYGLYFLSGLFAALAILAVIGLHGYKVVQQNPADVLKSE